MKVTKFNYPLEDNLIKKIDLMIDRCITKKQKKDNLLLCEGSEGEGKTTLSIGIAYYVADKTGRKFSNKNVFFNIEKMIEFAQNNINQIIIWDEPALQALSTDWATGAVKDITRLLMTIRKNRHFFIFNIVKFYKFNEYIIVDRPMGMIHVYSRKNIKSGRFVYIRKKKLEALWSDYRTKKKRSYKKYASRKVRGTFPNILDPKYKNNVLSDFDYEAYEEAKDEGIKSIGSTLSRLDRKHIDQRNRAIYIIRKELKLSHKKTAEKLQDYGFEIKPSIISEIIQKFDSNPPTREI